MQRAGAGARLFFALWPDAALQARLAAWARGAAGQGRAMRRENIHLTLAFLGETPAARIPDLAALARGIEFPPIRLELDRVGYWKHNRIVWCGAERDPPALTALVDALRNGLDAAAIAYDHKPFVSHLTLLRNAPGLQQVPPWETLVWEARDFALVQSATIDGRVTYPVLQRFPAAPVPAAPQR